MSTIGSHDAFVDLVDRHRGILFKVAGAYCQDPSDREDLIAEIVVALWRAHARFDGRSSFATWTYRIAVNVAIAFYRRDVRRRRDLVPVEESILAAIAAPAEAAQDERLDFLRELIDRLEPLDRALMLLYLDEYPHGEIAAMLGISESNVGTKIGRIKERFRRTAAQRQP
ncbi:MAG TPA: sigma-70 family RNA polymerase sigma factor [Candidatus Cybelea sp.]|jgi:RNA polymerase sigma-70 factor (ECF subfamily)|nr:sigma-70 family RNA polymerase sigma factor [Candidatus Cybelea sp.]